jgi:endo-1,4-beta-mannosidase
MFYIFFSNPFHILQNEDDQFCSLCIIITQLCIVLAQEFEAMKENIQRGLFSLCSIALLLVSMGYIVLSTFAATHPRSDFVTTSGTQLTLRGQPYTITGINYYPQDTPWDKFWVNYNGKTSDKDFTLLNTLHINAVRIFLPFYEFGGANVGHNPPPQPGSPFQMVSQPLEKLTDLLARAKTHHLHLIVTLFDFHTDYSLQHWAQAEPYLKTILTRFRDDPTILAWDLKNEPNLDYPASGKGLVDSWLAHIAHLAHLSDPHHLLTIGWSNSVAAQTRIPGIDFVSFHYYLPVTELPQAYAALDAAIPDLPILLTEFGLSTAGTHNASTAQLEDAQKQYYAAIFQFWQTTQSPGTFCWTLYDFTYIPPLFGNDPQQIEAQKHFGLVHDDGTLKPVAALVASHSSSQKIPLLPLDTWLQPAMIVVAFLLVIFIVLLKMHTH